MKYILVLNGPNLNLTGKRNPVQYGSETLDDINEWLAKKANTLGMDLSFFQTNIEGELVTALQNADGKYAGVVLNAGGYTHYSIAIRDAIEAVSVPVIEVHLSNIDNREEFRRTSVLSPVCSGTVSGFGKIGYYLALCALSEDNHD